MVSWVGVWMGWGGGGSLLGFEEGGGWMECGWVGVGVGATRV